MCLLWQQYLLGLHHQNRLSILGEAKVIKQTTGLNRCACRGRVEGVQASSQHLAQEVVLGNALLGHHVDQGPEGAVLLSLRSSPEATCNCWTLSEQ